MSSKRVLEDIFYFLNTIVNSASTSSEWNPESVNKAFKWALHCENIYHGASSGNGNQELNTCIKELANVIPDSAVPLADLQYLQSARNELTIELLQNTQLPITIYRDQLEKCIDNHAQIENLERISSVKNGLLQMFYILKENDSNRQIFDSFLMHRYMWKHLSQLLDRNDSEKWLSDFLESLKTNDDMKCILSMLCQQSLNNEREATIINLNVLRWIISHTDLRKATYNCDVAKLLWTQPAELLCEVANKHLSFFEHYVNWIEHEGSVLAQNFLQSGFCTELASSEVVCHMKALLSSEKATEVEKKLPSGIFWEDLVIMCKSFG